MSLNESRQFFYSLKYLQSESNFMLQHTITEYGEVIMLAHVFRRGGVNVVYGQSGIGKTISTIKALNTDGFTPILLDFDDNNSPEQNKCEFVHVNGWDFMKSYNDPAIATIIPINTIIVIDTWHMFNQFYSVNPEILQDLAEENTIIIIGHVVDLATRQDIPDIPTEFVNHCDAKLFLSYDNGSSVKGRERPAGTVLEVKKLRGYSGPKHIFNWAREPK